MSTPPKGYAAAASAGAAAPAPDTNAPASASNTDGKTVQCLVLDTGALIKNEPSVSTLIGQAHELYTIPAVLTEIRDAETRRRVDTTLRPFLTIRSPKPESIRFITGFARRTGDLEVLSAPDIHLLALTYELECERNGGDGRLRNTPGQKHLNGEQPTEGQSSEASASNHKEESVPSPEAAPEATKEATSGSQEEDGTVSQPPPANEDAADEGGWEVVGKLTLKDSATKSLPVTTATPAAEVSTVDDAPAEAQQDEVQEVTEVDEDEVDDDDQDGDSDDSDGWITPSNLKKHVAADQTTSGATQSGPEFLQAALLTTDYAMQNVALRINLNLLSTSLFRITRLRTYCLRCHGCFAITKDMTKQFCHKCGQPTLIRTSCSVDENGVFQVYLKKNFQFIKRGNVYSIPKPIHGTASGKVAKLQGGGHNAWGNSLVLAEDQKEYTRAKTERQRARQRDLMDEDYLPNILTGERKGGVGERPRVGAGRGVNSRKRRT
ncbi:related to art-4 protein [Cephalotrichum gorgonifer]|uniref:20S-pre-rRNA D-site endonuclease NOB1 n=1 Tax=Cephalotrichum gorgonifer TaxID=2041049 RepID=A0AAE8SZF6_9PEZI|nr:related to art-4 protein [Cephalotrichum gorgonifer]